MMFLLKSYALMVLAQYLTGDIYAKTEEENYEFFYPDIGLNIETSGKVYLYDGYIYHDAIISLPELVNINKIEENCRDDIGIFSDGTAYNFLNKAYINQLETLQSDIPETHILQLLQCETPPCYQPRSHEEEKRLIKSTHEQVSAVKYSHNTQLHYHIASQHPNYNNNTHYASKNPLFVDYDDDKLYTVVKGRKKREPITIAIVGGLIALAGAGVVTSLLNTGNIKEVENHIRSVDEKLNTIIHNVNDINSDTYQIGKRIDNISTLVIPNIAESIDKIAHKLDCQESNLINFSANIATWLSNIPSKIMRILNSAYAGKLTPDIFPLTLLEEFVKSNLAFHNTPYYTYPHLIYEMGSTVLMRVIHVPFTLQILLIIPAITPDIPNLLYNVHNVNYLISNVNMRLKVPSEVAIDPIEKLVWRVDKTTCKTGFKIMVCPHESITMNMEDCLHGIINHNNTAKCTPYPIREDITIIQGTISGILIGYTKKDHTITQYRSSGSPVIKKYKAAEHPVYISRESGNYLEYDGRVYSLKKDITSYKISTPKMSYINNKTYSPEVTIPTYLPLDIADRPTIDSLQDLNTRQDIFIYILYICLITFIVYVVIRIRSKHNPVSHKKSTFYSASLANESSIIMIPADQIV